jgi:hypothetical protein
MAEDWRTAYGRVKMELDEYKETIVPALMEKVRKLEQRWIPVNVRKPQEFVSVLIYAPGMAPLPTVYESYLAKGCWVTRTMILQEHDVTHWMEMPKGPGEVE